VWVLGSAALNAPVLREQFVHVFGCNALAIVFDAEPDLISFSVVPARYLNEVFLVAELDCILKQVEQDLGDSHFVCLNSMDTSNALHVEY
jgi:hypothetical protein